MKSLRLGPGVESVVIPVSAMVVSLIPFGIFLLCVGYQPFKVFASMYRGSFGNSFSISNSLVQASPLLLTALCTALPARLGMVIIGGEGALALGGLFAAVTPHFLPDSCPALMVIVLMCAVGMIAGGLWIMLAGALKYYRGVNETISSLLLYYIAVAIFKQLVEGPWRDPATTNKPSTWQVGDKATMPTISDMLDKYWPNFQPWIGNLPDHTWKQTIYQFLDGSLGPVHLGFFIGIAFCLIFWVVLQHTTLGFSIRIIGGNIRAARVAGLSVGIITLLVCFFAGASAGLAGAIEISAQQGCANTALLDGGYGFAGILVAFMARQNPMGVIPVSLLLGGIAASNTVLQTEMNMSDATVKVLMGILFVVILASESLYGKFKIFQRTEPAGLLPLGPPTDKKPILDPEEVASV